jgi:hypothetical protein
MLDGMVAIIFSPDGATRPPASQTAAMNFTWEIHRIILAERGGKSFPAV